MKERLEKFIRTEGLTPSRFAEIMGVQPSNISHILGGRNKPSFDFIEKMLLRFPKVNPDWLLLGKGSIYRTPEVSSLASPVTPVTNPAQPSGSTSPAYTLPFDAPSTGESHTTELSDDTSCLSHSQATFSKGAEPNTDAPKNNATQPSTLQTVLPQVSDEMIDQIVIFLKDKTFLAYRPK